MLDARHSGCRLIHGESDGLPGVVADRYGDTVVLQLSAAGAERWRDALVDALAAATGAACIYERSDADVRNLEGLAVALRRSRAARCRPRCCSSRTASRIASTSSPARRRGSFSISATAARRCARLAAGRETLNMFCYTGGFTLAALAGGATRVLSIDSSADALAIGRENLARNPALDASRAEWHEA